MRRYFSNFFKIDLAYNTSVVGCEVIVPKVNPDFVFKEKEAEMNYFLAYDKMSVRLKFQVSLLFTYRRRNILNILQGEVA